MDVGSFRDMVLVKVNTLPVMRLVNHRTEGSEHFMGNGRKTVYNSISSPEKLAKVNPENIQLGNDFLEYLTSIDRSKSTVDAYRNDLNIFWCWCLEFNNNKFFVDLSKREIVKYQNYCLNTLGWSPARMRRVKSTLSSLSNYIESMLDDEFDFRPIIRKIENPAACTVREKTILEEEQLQKLLNVLVEKEQFDKACMLSLAMNNGRRKAELPRMKVSYFTEDNVIYGSLYKTPETVTTKGRGSRGKQLTVYTLRNGFQKYLNLWLNYRDENNITFEWLRGTDKVIKRGKEYFFYTNQVLDELEVKIAEQTDDVVGILLDVVLTREEQEKCDVNDFSRIELSRKIYVISVCQRRDFH